MSEFLYERPACSLSWRGAKVMWLNSYTTPPQIRDQAWASKGPFFIIRHRTDRVWLANGDLGKALYEVTEHAMPRDKDRLVFDLLRVSDELVYSNGP